MSWVFPFRFRLTTKAKWVTGISNWYWSSGKNPNTWTQKVHMINWHIDSRFYTIPPAWTFPRGYVGLFSKLSLCALIQRCALVMPSRPKRLGWSSLHLILYTPLHFLSAFAFSFSGTTSFAFSCPDSCVGLLGLICGFSLLLLNCNSRCLAW